MNGQLEFLDIITLYSVFLQTLEYDITVNQSSNDDILKEIKGDMAILKNDIQEIKDILRGAKK